MQDKEQIAFKRGDVLEMKIGDNDPLLYFVTSIIASTEYDDRGDANANCNVSVQVSGEGVHSARTIPVTLNELGLATIANSTCSFNHVILRVLSRDELLTEIQFSYEE